MWLLLALACGPAELEPPEPEPVFIMLRDPKVHVDRAGRELFVVEEGGKVVRHEPIGIGRGGLKEKTEMSDLVTPTGTFTVDVILRDGGKGNAVAPEAVAKFADEPAFAELLSGEPGLEGLWANMGGIDFDGDRAPDKAYGHAYVGLTSESAVTGPKMRRHSKSQTPYWYSIALHGTPKAENLGAANSGGCVHVGPQLLDYLIDLGIVKLGAEVTIADGPPG